MTTTQPPATRVPGIAPVRRSPKARFKRRSLPGAILSHVVLLAATVVFGYPLLWMLFGAGKTMRDFFSNLWWIPSPYHWENLVTVLFHDQIGKYLINSAFVTAASIGLCLVLTYPLSFAVARLRFPGHGIVHAVFAICLFVPVQLMVIPLFSLEDSLGILDTFWGLILPYTAMSMPFSVVFVTAFLRNVPREIEEAAILDGASRVRVMLHVMVPLSLPAFPTSVVFGFLHVWNEFLIALTMTHSPDVRTLPLGLLSYMQNQDQPDFAGIFAALSISVVPVLAVFLAAQKQFLNGLMAGATKL